MGFGGGRVGFELFFPGRPLAAGMAPFAASPLAAGPAHRVAAQRFGAFAALSCGRSGLPGADTGRVRLELGASRSQLAVVAFSRCGGAGRAGCGTVARLECCVQGRCTVSGPGADLVALFVAPASAHGAGMVGTFGAGARAGLLARWLGLECGQLADQTAGGGPVAVGHAAGVLCPGLASRAGR